MYIIDVEDLRKELYNAKVHFSFFKKDGTLRTTCGTLKKELIPENLRSKNDIEIDVSVGERNLRFFDLEKKDWRSLPKGTNVVTLFE